MTLLGVFIVVVALLYWWHAFAIKEAALKYVLQHCEAVGVELLDQTLALHKLYFGKVTLGRLKRHSLLRHYEFEFTSTREQRYSGHIIMSGRYRVSVHLDPHRILPE